MRNLLAVVLLAPFIVTGCGSEPPTIDPDYRVEIEAAWAEREARLTADDGWLTLTGLYWLSPGPNIVGSAEDAAVRLPDGPELVGSLHLAKDGTVTLLPDPEAGLMVNDEPAIERPLASDSSGAPDLLRSGRALFFLIERGIRIGVRVRDPESRTRREFPGLDHYPIDPRYRVDAHLAPYTEPRQVAVPTVIGEPSTMLAPGTLTFELAGQQLSLEPYVSGPDDRGLFLVFRDATSGDTTYGAGRFLDARLADDGSAVLDFNLAVNPPCAFTPFATCPLPTPENTLFVPIEAGEKHSGKTH
jgi:uncharacterized protein (DUF1684 family)